MRITDVEVIQLADPAANAAACDSSQDAIVVLVHTDEGITGIGEVDATPAATAGFLSAPSSHSFSLGLTDLLIGQDPLDTRRLWHRLYEGSLMAGRRGMGVHALGAIDVALWDIRGKAAGQPIWKLLGGAMHSHIVPYASVLPVGTPGAGIDANAFERVALMQEAGFKAVKIEPVPQTTTVDDATVVSMIRAAREALGPDVVLMADVGYRWRDAKSALRCMRQLEEFDLFFIETPLHFDNIAGIADVVRASNTRVAYGEIQATRFEFFELMDVGQIDVVQPDIPRCGGITEAVRIAEAAEDRGRLVVPHAWSTGITTAAAVHVAAVTASCPYVEYLPPEFSGSLLRRDLLLSEPTAHHGIIDLPSAPGLGVTINPEALERYRVS